MTDLEDVSHLSGNGPVVLVVDDERTPRAIVSRMVRGLGYAVLNCGGGREALDVLRRRPREVRLLLADVAMPRMDGGELAERARDLDPSLRIALMAHPGDAHAAALLEGYRDLPLLAKPVGFQDLSSLLDALLEKPMATPNYPPSMGPPRVRTRRRPSGSREV